MSTAPNHIIDTDDEEDNDAGDNNNPKIPSSSSSAGHPWEEPEDLPTHGEWEGCRRTFMAPIQISARGADILVNPLFNKGTAFKYGERDRLRFRGLLPHRVMNITKQKERFLKGLRELDSNIRKNIWLEDLHDRNETLYHRVLVDHIEEMAPLIYTPTVGQACLELSSRYRRPRGMYFTEDDRGHMAAMYVLL
jgi:malate dehydrogenase (oxaloacetate-decarboxylating)(NADP+)